ncbi:MAG TPA: preprotein translocase subunit YajC [Clostridiaceae bacterium]|nr:preprotein translocase subunit YajC [Clostridiaceae bacterium]
MTEFIAQSWPIMLVIGVFYFVTFVPEQKRRKAYFALLADLRVNDQVATKGGILGRIVSLDQDTIILETGPDRVRIKFSRGAVSTRTSTSEIETGTNE